MYKRQVQQQALAHPEISFRFLKDGQEQLHTDGQGDRMAAIYAIYGRELANNMLSVDGSWEKLRVRGFVTKPTATRGNRAWQSFFVNNRYIKSRLLSAALEEAYRNQIMVGRFPACVLEIDMPVQAVDVNVHPAKTVVKFAAEKAVFDAVHYTVKDALDGEGRPKAAEKPFYQTMTAQEFLKRPDAPKPSQAVTLPAGKAIGSAAARPVVTAAPVQPAPVPVPAAPAMAVRDVAPEADKPFTAPAAPGVVYHITPPEETAERPEMAPSPAPAAEPEQQEIAMPEGPAAAEQPWRVAGEVLKTYIICEDAERNVWLIDKHAAHERMRFDALKARTEPPMRQLLLTPAAVTLAAEEYTAVLENLELLADCGFLCEDFGDGTVLVREVPDDVRAEDAAATLEELAQKLRLHSADRAALRDEVLHTVACKSAIKAGMTSDPAELRALAAQVQSGAVRYCPHGRPVAVKLREYEIEKMFKRA